MDSRALFMLIAFPIVGAGLIILQIFLSKKDSKWLGLILPCITFVIDLIFILSVTSANDVLTTIATILTTFVLGNIPTAVLLAIHVGYRKKHNRQRSIDKMSVQDL